MRLAATLIFLTAFAAAAPVDPVPLPSTIIAEPTVSVPLSTSLNVPTTGATLVPTLSVPSNWSSSRTRHHFSHWEPIPTFMSACNCPDLKTVPYPCWATDSLQVSLGDVPGFASVYRRG